MLPPALVQNDLVRPRNDPVRSRDDLVPLRDDFAPQHEVQDHSNLQNTHPDSHPLQGLSRALSTQPNTCLTSKRALLFLRNLPGGGFHRRKSCPKQRLHATCAAARHGSNVAG